VQDFVTALAQKHKRSNDTDLTTLRIGLPTLKAVPGTYPTGAALLRVCAKAEDKVDNDCLRKIDWQVSALLVRGLGCWRFFGVRAAGNGL
jgi:hypothetical protein